MAILKDQTEGHIFMDYEDKNKRGGGILFLAAVGPAVTRDVIAACEHMLKVEFYGFLLQSVLEFEEEGRHLDVVGLLCGKSGADVCENGEDDGDDAAHEEL